MNNDSAKVAAALRAFALYAACALLAIILGVLMTNPRSYASLEAIAVICAVMFLPILIKWHYPLMIVTWSMPVMMFFIKGDPNLFLVMISLSLLLTVVERAMGQKRFISVPPITWPLFCLIIVVGITAKLTGGIGLRAFGSDVYGGKKYVFLIVAILGYFAIASRPIPAEKAKKYVALYFAGGTLGVIQDFYSVAPHFLAPIYWLIPPTFYTVGGAFQVGVTRLAGTATAAGALANVLIACYGLRGIFFSGKLWRSVLFFLCFVLIFLGGFRIVIISFTATFFLLFFLEGLHRTVLLPFLAVCGLIGAVAIVPLGSKLPYTFQRALTVLPESVVHLRKDARMDAQDSWDWRVRMWTDLLPEIPKYFWLGKGYAISVEDFETEMGANAAISSTADASQQALALASDYHNGAYSVILPFGIWGVLAFLWFLAASNWVMYRNYRYSSPELKNLNTFLFVLYLYTSIYFPFGGSLGVAMNQFTGLLGLSVAINRGVRRDPAPQSKNIPFSLPIRRRGLQPAPAPVAPQFPIRNGRLR